MLRPSSLLTDRQGHAVRVRSGNDGWTTVTDSLSLFDTMMTHVADPRNAPEMLTLRESIRSWRFYDHFRTDSDAPARAPQVGTYTPVLSDDGADMAAAIQTIRLFGDSAGLDSTVDDAFPGSQLSVADDSGRFSVEMRQHGLLRPLRAAELSDGTLRYMLWIAALLTTRPPPLMVLNEPETSLHPSLIPALARLIVRASSSSQIIIVTHASQLIDALRKHSECHSIELEKSFGESVIVGAKEANRPPWHWPPR
jgi:predicted ATPase